MAVASMVLGIIALVMTFFMGGMGWIATIVGIIGIILGALAKKKSPEKKGMATAGLVMSIIAVATSLIVWIACISCAASIGLFA